MLYFPFKVSEMKHSICVFFAVPHLHQTQNIGVCYESQSIRSVICLRVKMLKRKMFNLKGKDMNSSVFFHLVSQGGCYVSLCFIDLEAL